MSKALIIVLCSFLLVSCGGNRTVKSAPPKPTTASQPAPSPATVPSTPSDNTDKPVAASEPPATKPGGYYLDDGPEQNPPSNLDSIPDAVPKQEAPVPRLNKPYVALGQTYKPMTASQSYKMRGIASWYGKRFHGKKTSSGEPYDMYAMTAAHPILPLPSYVRVTNLANNRSVIVRINDRGPFKKDRLIDLSYAAAHKLRLLAKGSGLVEVEAIDPKQAKNPTVAVTQPPAQVMAETAQINQENIVKTASTEPPESAGLQNQNTANPVETKPAIISGNPVVGNATQQAYYVQAGAFKSEHNADSLMKRLQGMDIAPNVGLGKVYNNDLHRLRLGPFDLRTEAEKIAGQLKKQFNIPAIILNQ